MSIKNTQPLPSVIVVLYDGFDMLDVSGPFAFFGAGGLSPVLAGLEKTRYKSGQGVEYVAQKSFSEISSVLDGNYVLWIPGGFGPDYLSQFSKNNPLLKWLADVSVKAKLVCAVCTGAHIAAAAGLLKGYKITTHWAFKEAITLFPDVHLVDGFPRFHVDRNRVTGGGISSGLDESLAVIAMLAGDSVAEQAQLTNQYAPYPPFNSGTPDVAPKEVLKNTLADLSGASSAVSATVKNFLKK